MKSFRGSLFLAALFFLAGIALPLPKAGEPSGQVAWPQFLGPHRDGLSSETGLNLDWKTRPPKVVWKVPLGGGFSSVVCVGDRLYSLAQRGERDFAVCLDAATGKERWAVDLAPTYTDKQRQGTGPRSTPTYANGKLYGLLPRGELVCLAAEDGKPVWKTNIFTATKNREPEANFFYWGMSGSPLVEGDLVIVQPGGDKDNSVAAFHADTGTLAWSVGSEPAGYASPIAIDAAGRRQIVASTGQSILGLDPAKGEVLWRYEFGNRTNCTCATPIWSDGLLFVSAAYGTGSAALEIVRDGDKLMAREKWKNKNMQNHFTNSVILDGKVYGCHGDIAALSFRCVDLKTGELLWNERLTIKCSMVGAEGHLFCMGERGTLRLLEANPSKLVVKGESEEVLSYKTWATPALVKRKLYVRDEKDLVCLDLAKE
jgi:outer membrane protein assembly factor BamB